MTRRDQANPGRRVRASLSGDDGANGVLAAGPSVVELTIARLGHEGDGIAEQGGGVGHAHATAQPVFVAYTLPGERIRAEVHGDRGRLIEVLAPAPERVAPVCRHFGVCGGCAMQHAAPATYIDWKTALLGRALSQAGMRTVLEPMVTAGLHTRRRAIMGAKRGPHGVMLGFHEPRGHRILDVGECPILSPLIVDALPAIRELVAPLLPRFSKSGTAAQAGVGPKDGGLRIVATAADNGLDIVVEGAGRAVDAAARETIAAVASRARMVRVSLDRDPIYATAEPALTFGGVAVVPPPGVFLQAVPAIEHAMAGRIVAAITGKKGQHKRVADLFAGIGTFTLPIAAYAEVLAVDSDKRALAALADACRKAQGVKPVTTLARDLHREPLSARELDGFDAIIFDPPRAGAAEQATRIARSKAQTVIAVSCAPGTLARDLAILVEGGLVIESITPFDQFLYSPHVEAVAVLRRKRR